MISEREAGRGWQNTEELKPFRFRWWLYEVIFNGSSNKLNIQFKMNVNHTDIKELLVLPSKKSGYL